MSNGTSRRKGKVGEQEVVNFLKNRGVPAERAWEDASRKGGQIQGDLRLGTSPLHPLSAYYAEVRRRERLAVPTWLQEIDEDTELTGKTPLLITRRSRMPWWACVKLDHLIWLWKKGDIV